MVTAGELLLDGRDPEAMSIEEILRRAGTSASSFYQCFGSKEGFFDLLHERFCGRIQAETAALTDPARWAGRPLEEVAREGLRSYLGFRRAHTGALRSFEVLEGREPKLMARRRRVDVELARGALGCVETLKTADGRAPSPERIRMALDFAVSSMKGAVDASARVRAASHEDDARLVEELATALTSFLVGP